MSNLSWGTVSHQLTKSGTELHCHCHWRVSDTLIFQSRGPLTFTFAASRQHIGSLPSAQAPQSPLITLGRRLEATDSGVDDNGLVLTDLLGRSTGHSNPISPHHLLKMDKERGWSQGPCENCNFTAGMNLNFNNFGIHLWNVISVGSIL